MAGGGGEGGAVRGDKAAKPETGVRVCVLTFESVKPLNIFKETSERFLAMFEEANKTDICFRDFVFMPTKLGVFNKAVEHL